MKSFVDVPPNDPEQLKAALVLGPVAIAIEADQDVFLFYKDGIIDDVNESDPMLKCNPG